MHPQWIDGYGCPQSSAGCGSLKGPLMDHCHTLLAGERDKEIKREREEGGRERERDERGGGGGGRDITERGLLLRVSAGSRW